MYTVCVYDCINGTRMALGTCDEIKDARDWVFNLELWAKTCANQDDDSIDVYYGIENQEGNQVF